MNTTLRQKLMGLSAWVFIAAFALPAQAMNIQEVTSRGGIKAWLVQDDKLPLIAMQFAFRGGVEQDPADKQGLATLTMNLLTEGAGPYDADTFQEELAGHSINMGFEASRDALLGSVKTLRADKDKAFDLLHMALTKPHFEASAIERLRAQQLVGIKSQFGSPDWQARYALFRQIFGNHPYSQRRLGNLETLQHLTRNDIQSFAAHHLARNNLIIAVAGDISPNELAPLLDSVFGDLPKTDQQTSISDFIFPQEPATVLVPREGTQTALLFAMPGPKRDDPDWYAADIANYILGGGGFSSRLMQDVRDKNGLTYGISTSLSAMDYGGVIVGDAATDNNKTQKAWSIASDTIRNFYDNGATEKEVSAAKDYLTGALPLTMTSTDRIAGALVSMQLEHLSRDYMDRYNDLIRNVTSDDINRVIKRWFNPDHLTLVMVGKPDGMTASQTQEPVRQ